MPYKQNQKPKGVTIQIAADILGVSVNTLRNWDKKGKLPATRTKNGYRHYKIRDLMHFAKENKLRPKKIRSHER